MQSIPHIALIGEMFINNQERIKKMLYEILEDYLQNSSYLVITLLNNNAFDGLCGEVLQDLKKIYSHFYVELFYNTSNHRIDTYPAGVVDAAHYKDDPCWWAVWQSTVVLSYFSVPFGRKFYLYRYAKKNGRYAVNLARK